MQAPASVLRALELGVEAHDLLSLHIQNIHDVLQEAKLEIVVFFTRGGQRGGSIHFNQPTKDRNEFSVKEDWIIVKGRPG